ncbi:hypothetical protein V9T40_008361 [Parthenolecanium corni]|uniref:Uncharacterized protein n=1 Tax=Parthenolecanium corni TaxID=536013 RepID=A0AAN9Y805_9HEMI
MLYVTVECSLPYSLAEAVEITVSTVLKVETVTKARLRLKCDMILLAASSSPLTPRQSAAQTRNRVTTSFRGSRD